LSNYNNYPPFLFLQDEFEENIPPRVSLPLRASWQGDAGLISPRFGYDRLKVALFGEGIWNYIPDKNEQRDMRKTNYWGGRVGGGAAYNTGSIIFYLNGEYQFDPYFQQWVISVGIDLYPLLFGDGNYDVIDVLKYFIRPPSPQDQPSSIPRPYDPFGPASQFMH